jgi:hypothetical protein
MARLSQDPDRFRCRFCHRDLHHDLCACGIDDLAGAEEMELPLDPVAVRPGLFVTMPHDRSPRTRTP